MSSAEALGDPRYPTGADSNLPEGIAGPDSSFVEPLTPDYADDHRSRYSSDDSGQLQAVAQSLLGRLRLPLLLDYILRTADEFEQHGESLRSTLLQRTVSERLRIRSVAQGLYRSCDDLCDDLTQSVIPETDVSCHHSHARLEAGNVNVQGDTIGGSMTDPGHPIKPGHNIGDAGCETTLGTDGEVPNSDILSSEDSNGYGQSYYQCAGAQDQPPISILEANERARKLSGSLHSTPPRPRTPASDTSDASLAGNTLVAVSPRTPASAPRRPPAASRNAPRVKPVHREQDCLHLVRQPLQDFINDSYEQVRQLSLRDNSPGTYKALLDALKRRRDEDKTRWSDGSQWVSLVEAGHGERGKGSIRYALITTSFAGWHASQVCLLGGIDSKTAAKEVSARILGPKPEDETAEKRWEQNRKSLAAHLSRGRKWSRLVEDLGAGILLRNAWRLAKSRGPELETLRRELLKSPEKMLVLKLLTDQMSLLLETGKMDQHKFSDELRTAGFSVLDAGPSLQCSGLDAFHERLRDSTSADTLLVKGSKFRFGIDSLRRLRGRRWLNDEVILACLHLSDELASVRVGFSVPIHQQTRACSVMPRPFERAAKQIEEWQTCETSQSYLVCFYPLLQHQSHFSLMEINERDETIYHYDSMSKGENTDIKVACEKEFPQFQYVEVEGLRQRDGYSCGPLVIRHARYRILGQAVAVGNVDRREAETLRCEAVSILQSAWVSDALIAAPEVRGRKRRVTTPKEGCEDAKRQNVQS